MVMSDAPENTSIITPADSDTEIARISGDPSIAHRLAYTVNVRAFSDWVLSGNGVPQSRRKGLAPVVGRIESVDFVTGGGLTARGVAGLLAGWFFEPSRLSVVDMEIPSGRSHKGWLLPHVIASDEILAWLGADTKNPAMVISELSRWAALPPTGVAPYADVLCGIGFPSCVHGFPSNFPPDFSWRNYPAMAAATGRVVDAVEGLGEVFDSPNHLWSSPASLVVLRRSGNNRAVEDTLMNRPWLVSEVLSESQMSGMKPSSVAWERTGRLALSGSMSFPAEWWLESLPDGGCRLDRWAVRTCLTPSDSLPDLSVPAKALGVSGASGFALRQGGVGSAAAGVVDAFIELRGLSLEGGAGAYRSPVSVLGSALGSLSAALDGVASAVPSLAPECKMALSEVVRRFRMDSARVVDRDSKENYGFMASKMTPAFPDLAVALVTGESPCFGAFDPILDTLSNAVFRPLSGRQSSPLSAVAGNFMEWIEDGCEGAGPEHSKALGALALRIVSVASARNLHGSVPRRMMVRDAVASLVKKCPEVASDVADLLEERGIPVWPEVSAVESSMKTVASACRPHRRLSGS